MQCYHCCAYDSEDTNLRQMVSRDTLDPSAAYAFVDYMTKKAGLDRISLYGGETLLHPDLVELVNTLQGILDRAYETDHPHVQIITNGLRMPDDEEALFDYFCKFPSNTHFQFSLGAPQMLEYERLTGDRDALYKKLLKIDRMIPKLRAAGHDLFIGFFATYFNASGKFNSTHFEKAFQDKITGIESRHGHFHNIRGLAEKDLSNEFDFEFEAVVDQGRASCVSKEDIERDFAYWGVEGINPKDISMQTPDLHTSYHENTRFKRLLLRGNKIFNKVQFVHSKVNEVGWLEDVVRQRN